MRPWFTRPSRRQFFWLLGLFVASTAAAAAATFFDDGTDFVD